MKNRSGGHRHLVTAARTLIQRAGCYQVRFIMTALRANKPVWPSSFGQKLYARFIAGKTGLPLKKLMASAFITVSAFCHCLNLLDRRG
nr:hypothetical protein [Nitrosococcus wardiae]